MQPGLEAAAQYAPPLKYSSPWPWVLAIMISCTMWGGIGWVSWVFIR
jgi:hypothetical protein